MFKKMLLIFLCFTLFLSIPSCKKKLPTTPDIPTKVLPTIEYFHATPELISSGEPSILSWSVKNATNVTINQGVGTVDARAMTEVSPEETTTYTLTAINSDGQKTQACTVEVSVLPVIEYFTASPESIMRGAVSTLSWSVTNATMLYISPPGLEVPGSVGMPVEPTETTTYTLLATNDDGETTASCEIHVIPDYQGTWKGFYVFYDCEAKGDFAGWCGTISHGDQRYIELNLLQVQDQVIGSFILLCQQALFFGNVQGSIAEDGELWFKDVAYEGIYTIDAEMQLQSTIPGQITGDISWYKSGEDPPSYIQVSGWIKIPLTRN